MTILAAPARIRGVGRLVYGGDYGVPYGKRVTYGPKYGTRRLGDAGVFQIPTVAPKPDMDHVFTPAELAQLVFSSGDEAIAYYNWLVRTIALQTKIAFAVDLWKTVKQSPEMIGALSVTSSGQAWINAFVNSEAAFLSFTQPNMFQNLQLVRNQMEVNVLPKTYNIGVKGRLPAFVSGATELSYSDVLIDAPNVIGYVNFGDLTGTTVQDDTSYINGVVSKFAPTVKTTLGIWPVWVILLVAAVAVLISTYVFILIDEYIQAKKIPPEIVAALKNADPAMVEKILKQWGNIGGLFGGLSDTLMWGAIGLGIIFAGGTVLWFASK
jgi:hypothetical protein